VIDEFIADSLLTGKVAARWMTMALVTAIDCWVPTTVLTLFEAETTNKNGDPVVVVGVPDNTPELEFNVTPGGSEPDDTEKVGAGVPVAT
jgi:hypothetical protein